MRDNEHPAQTIDIALGKSLLEQCTEKNRISRLEVDIDEFAQYTIGEAMYHLAQEVLNHIREQNSAVKQRVTDDDIKRVMSNQYMRKSCHLIDGNLVFKFEIPDIADVVIEIPKENWKFGRIACSDTIH